MKLAVCVAGLERFEAVLSAFVADVAREEAVWRPADGGWSILEIACHLADEEAEDFRARLRLTLEGAAEWPVIDPQGWAALRRYNEQDLQRVMERWIAERRASVAWLKTLSGADWSKSYRHPKLGVLCAGDLLTSWAAHDLLHLRQLVRRRYQLLERACAPYSTAYAGEW